MIHEEKLVQLYWFEYLPTIMKKGTSIYLSSLDVIVNNLNSTKIQQPRIPNVCFELLSLHLDSVHALVQQIDEGEIYVWHVTHGEKLVQCCTFVRIFTDTEIVDCGCLCWTGTAPGTPQILTETAVPVWRQVGMDRV